MTDLRLGVNIDHVATVRNARGSAYPDPVRAAKLAEESGADGITAHLREDRRHITDGDIDRLMAALTVPLNFEMAATDEMQKIACATSPTPSASSPKSARNARLRAAWKSRARKTAWPISLPPLREAGCRVSIFIAADMPPRSRRPTGSVRLSSNCIPAPTAISTPKGKWPNAMPSLTRLREMSAFADSLGLEVHAGHGLTYDTVAPVAAFP